MCGIAGLIVMKAAADYQSVNTLLPEILAAQHSRGPDHTATLTVTTLQTEVQLGHNRLKILDLSTAANQPMQDGLQRYVLTYNGEIYNYLALQKELTQLGHVFITHADTEVLLYAFQEWGVNCLNKLNGMFAFAIYDKLLQKLWLVRDRFGVKPLYYFKDKSCLVFASSSATIAKHFKLNPNFTYLQRGLSFGVYEDHSNICAYENLFAVDAGCYVEVSVYDNAVATKLTRYYDFVESVAKQQILISELKPDALFEKLLTTLSDATQLRLHADVPVAVALSGGLDSTSIAALATQLQADLVGFTFGDPNIKYSEGPLAAAAAKKLNIKLHYIWPDQKQIADSVMQTILAQDAPFPNASVIAQYLVYQRVRQENIKVLIGGQGGDEALMGYRKFQWFYLQELLRNKQYAKACGHFMSFLRMLFAELTRMQKFWQIRHRYFKNTGQQTILQFPKTELNMGAAGMTATDRQIADILTYSLPTLLRYEDRNSMAHSIESRLPFMDYRVLELAVALPMALKLNKGYGKWALRHIMLQQVPDSIRLARYKRGFDVKQSTWIQGEVAQCIRQQLCDHKNSIHVFLPEQASIETLFSDQQLADSSQRFAEALTLLWLGDK